MDELTLPSFELDCRDWLVAQPADVGLPEEIAGSPVLAVLSTAIIDYDELYSVGAVLSLGLIDEGEDGWIGLRGGGIRQLVDAGSDERLVRYVVPSPNGRLGLLAEFTMDEFASPALRARMVALMASFRWAD